MTEEEAKKKWCPMVSFHGSPEHGGGSNRPDYLTGCNCIASDCTVWKWDDKQIVGEFMPEHGGKPEKQRGYCGLAQER